MKLKEFLKKENWAQHTHAADYRDLEVHPCDPEAIRFCVEGALAHLNDDEDITVSEFVNEQENRHDSAYFKLQEFVRDLGHDTIPEWNDHQHTTFREVEAVLEYLNI